MKRPILSNRLRRDKYPLGEIGHCLPHPCPLCEATQLGGRLDSESFDEPVHTTRKYKYVIEIREKNKSTKTLPGKRDDKTQEIGYLIIRKKYRMATAQRNKRHAQKPRKRQHAKKVESEDEIDKPRKTGTRKRRPL